jgi:hypothetical protein
MTEKEAWLYLAELWSEPIKFGGCWYGCNDPPDWIWSYHYGLCTLIHSLNRTGRITDSIHRSMKAHGLLFDPKHSEVFWWNHGRTGAEHRVYACLFLAAMCDDS